MEFEMIILLTKRILEYFLSDQGFHNTYEELITSPNCVALEHSKFIN